MQFEASVTRIIQRTHDVRSIRFQRPDEFDFLPGQYMYVKLRRNGKELEKHFTISSSPTEKDHLEITKKLTGHEFSNALASLNEGDRAHIDGPEGEFTFEGEHDKIALITGGIGITPFQSIIRYSTDRGLKTQMTLLYSNSSEEEIVFRDELEEMQRLNKNLNVVHTTTRPSEKWRGLKGRINGEMIKKVIPDYRERVVYISGPQQMVDDIERILRKELKIPKKQIKMEYFPGY